MTSPHPPNERRHPHNPFPRFHRVQALCKLSGTPGSINKDMFKEGVSSLAFEDDAFVDRVFNLLDEDMSGSVEWAEFCNAVNALETGSVVDKLRFCFRVYDADGSESIDREELHNMFSSMLLSSGVPEGAAKVIASSPRSPCLPWPSPRFD